MRLFRQIILYESGFIAFIISAMSLMTCVLIMISKVDGRWTLIPLAVGTLISTVVLLLQRKFIKDEETR